MQSTIHPSEKRCAYNVKYTVDGQQKEIEEEEYARSVM